MSLPGVKDLIDDKQVIWESVLEISVLKEQTLTTDHGDHEHLN